jgi:acyl-coenzyme A thioesterase PaaI-like protein
MSAAVMTTLDAATGHTTAMLTVHLTRAITARTAKVSAEGWVVHRGSRLVTAEARLNDEQGRLLGHGSGTYSLNERASS